MEHITNYSNEVSRFIPFRHSDPSPQSPIEQGTGFDLPFGGRIFRQGENQILELRFAEQEIREFELKMMQYCDVQGILKPTVQRQEGFVLLRFDISGSGIKNDRQAAESYLERLSGLQTVLPEYLLTIEGVVVDAQYSFYFESRDEWKFLYLPLRRKKEIQDLSFFRGFFSDNPQIMLQMEMMRENPALVLTDYLQVIKGTIKKSHLARYYETAAGKRQFL